MTQPRLVGGRYELGELIGYGGMAEVHRGRDLRLGRDVAIKVLRADLARDPSFLNRFRREAQSAAGLNHPSIVSVYDTGEDVGGEGTTQPYIVMEYVQGRTLRDILKAEGRLPARRAMEIVADVAAALDFSHRAGLIHRDVKPANVMITQNGAVKVMDFGIARAVADNSATVTQTANVIGTAQYLSPEQARGETVDARSDVYSTGCLLYELVTGVPPFQGDSPVAVAYQHVRENATSPSSRVPELPRALDSIVMKALAKNPQNRYQSAGEMRTDLQRALADQPVTAESVMTDDERTQFIARTPPPIIPTRPPLLVEEEEPRRNTAAIWTAIVVALLLVAGVAGFFIWKVASDGGNNGPAQPTTVALPPLLGKSVAEANQALLDVGNTANCVQDQTCKIYLEANPKGATTSNTCDADTPQKTATICTLTNDQQQPITAGTQVPAGTHVYYQTYLVGSTNVPYVKGETFQQAADAIQKAGLVPKEGKAVDTFDVAKDHVVSTDPSDGTKLDKGKTVTIHLSSGKVTLPDMRGKKYGDYKNRLNALGWLKVTAEPGLPTSDKNRVGNVYSVDPSPGNKYASDTPITLHYFRYKPPPPSCDPNKTPTPTNKTSPSSPGGSSGASDSPSSPAGSSPSGPSSGASSSSSSASSTNTLPPCGQPSS